MTGVFLTSTSSGTVSYDTAWAVSGSVGYFLADRWRLEAEAGFAAHDVDAFALQGDSRAFTLAANVLYDYPLSSTLSVLLGAGIGADFTDLEALGQSDSASALIVQGVAGVEVRLDTKTHVSLRYRFRNTGGETYEFESPDPLLGRITLDFEDRQEHLLTFGLGFSL